MEEKVENNDSCVGFGEDHHRSADDMIGKEASPIEDRDKNNGGLAPCAGGPTPEPQLLQQGETAGAAGASELPVVVEGRDDETVRGLCPRTKPYRLPGTCMWHTLRYLPVFCRR